MAKPIAADPIKKDFRKFLFIVWKTLNLPDPTPIQYDMGNYLQVGQDAVSLKLFVA